MNKEFTCTCKDGETKVINEMTVKHKCGFIASTPEKFLNVWHTYKRVQVSLIITDGIEKYNWFMKQE